MSSLSHITSRMISRKYRYIIVNNTINRNISTNISSTGVPVKVSTTLLLSTETLSHIRWALGGWLLFLGENILLSENRTYIINDLLNNNNEMYHTLYGTCSTIATVTIGYGYYKLRKVTPPTTTVPKNVISLPMLAVSSIITSIGLIMASQSAPKIQLPLEFVTPSSSSSSSSSLSTSSLSKSSDEQSTTVPSPSTNIIPITSSTTTNTTPKGEWKLQVRCPFDFTDNNKNNNTAVDGTDVVTVTGIERITRHPGLWTLATVGIGNSLLQPTVPLKLFWLGPTLIAYFGGNHTDSRYLRNIGGSMNINYYNVTSNIPFYSILSGKQGNNPITTLSTLIKDELKLSNALVAVGIVQIWILTKGRYRR